MSTMAGRERGFDRDEVPDQATRASWRDGHRATRVADLTATTGVTPPGPCAAFGGERALFAEAVTRYRATCGAFTTRALEEEPTGPRAVERIRDEAATGCTTPGRPPGCPVLGAPGLRDERERAGQGPVAGIRHDVVHGVLPGDTDASAPAAFVAATTGGMSAPTRDGASGDELRRVARTTLLARPAPVP